MSALLCCWAPSSNLGPLPLDEQRGIPIPNVQPLCPFASFILEHRSSNCFSSRPSRILLRTRSIVLSFLCLLGSIDKRYLVNVEYETESERGEKHSARILVKNYSHYWRPMNNRSILTSAAHQDPHVAITFKTFLQRYNFGAICTRTFFLITWLSTSSIDYFSCPFDDDASIKALEPSSFIGGSSWMQPFPIWKIC